MTTSHMNYTEQWASDGYFPDQVEWPAIPTMAETIRLPNIIHRPDLQNPLRRGGNGLVTILAWAVWIYLFLPALEVISQLLGYTQFPFGLRAPISPSTDQTITTLIVYGFLVAIAGGLLVVWATYNLVRFRQRERRRGPEQIRTRELADSDHVTMKALGRLQASQIVWLDHDERGEITDVRPRVKSVGVSA
ncbi:poly-beta-1,6-N-acetyl-D-glucosamine biosynthesis protein PgaD [Salinisphaera sp. SPP-AMP-43]|uniref:poly-beta-1,6-N-acetyl-D-glucosamine biosynthesis protein PgaD n=1 Tax=Salinisphaera sp. SPP-AMP-43 TaxID=3121288 RepID=UPI003C6E4908